MAGLHDRSPSQLNLEVVSTLSNGTCNQRMCDIFESFRGRTAADQFLLRCNDTPGFVCHSA